MEFYVPGSLADDYKAFLQTSACFDIQYCRDVSAREPVWLPMRAEISAINYKSKQYGSDNAARIGVAYDSPLQKGDMVLHDGRQYLVTWQLNRDRPNAKTSTIEMTNIGLEFMRNQEETVDPNTGKLLQKAGLRPVGAPVRGVIILGGNYEYRTGAGRAGVAPNNRMTLYLQANPTTLTLALNDVFQWRGVQHVIRDIIYSELNYDGETGLLVLHVEKSLS